MFPFACMYRHVREKSFLWGTIAPVNNIYIKCFNPIIYQPPDNTTEHNQKRNFPEKTRLSSFPPLDPTVFSESVNILIWLLLKHFGCVGWWIAKVTGRYSETNNKN